MTKHPGNTGWRCLGTHPEGSMWAVEIPTGVLMRFSYFIPGPESRPVEGNSMCFVPGLFIVTETDRDGDRHARLEVME